MAKSTRNGETQMAQTFRQQLEAAGFKTVPDNHWIYSEGPSIILIPIEPVPEDQAIDVSIELPNEMAV